VCLIVIAYKVNANYPLVIAANRDEFYNRPSEAASFWPDAPNVLAGRDLKGGGTWLGLTSEGRVAAITNFRNPTLAKSGAPSRGLLVSNYLRGSSKAEEYLKEIQHEAAAYNGFNLIAGDLSRLFCFSNINNSIVRITPGIHGLSNHLLDTPWPKVTRAKKLLMDAVTGIEKPSPQLILEILSDTLHPPDEELPDSGIGLDWERMLSPLFISSSCYGTCSSTVILVDMNMKATFMERVSETGYTKPGTKTFSFDLSADRISKDL
jgi:uncharacterized protein with NRDE domain